MNTATANGHLSLAGTPAASPLGYVSWSMVQLARDPYYIIVVIYIFFPYFSNYVVGDPVRGQALIGYMNSSAGLLLALMAPIAGAIADQRGRRKPWVAWSSLIVAVGATLLWFVMPGGQGLGVYPALALIFVITVAFSISEVFHNAMLPTVAPVHRVGFISGLALSLGNLGGLSLMLFVLLAISMPGTVDWSFLPAAPLFAIDQSLQEHNRIVGPITGLWLFIFTLPLLLFTPDGKSSGGSLWRAGRQGIVDVLQTVKQLKHYANIARYLLARMFFFDGMVGVMTFAGIYVSAVFGWGTTTLLMYGLITSASAMCGAFIGGWLDDKLGSIRVLQMSILVSLITLTMMVSIEPEAVFFVVPVSTEALWDFPYFATAAEFTYLCTNQIFAMFFVAGLGSSRSLMARLAPPEMASQFFGLYALSGTVTAFLAPLLVATTTSFFQSQRIGFGSLTVLLIIGAIILMGVKQEQSSVAPQA